MVFVDVRPVLFFAFVRHARAHDFAQAVEVVAFQPQALLDFLSHVLRPGFRTEGTDAQAQVVLAQSHAFGDLG